MPTFRASRSSCPEPKVRLRSSHCSDAASALLKRRRAERDALLARAQESLEGDPRVVAAWLFGSVGRGTEDALSDLDLFVVIADEHLEAVLAERDAFMARLGMPVLVLE